MQTSEKKKSTPGPSDGVVGTAEKILSRQGVRGFYRGLGAYVVLCLRPAIQYAVFEQLKALVLLKRKKTQVAGANKAVLSALEAFALGAVARAVATFVVYPYIKAKVMAQANVGGGTSPEVAAYPPSAESCASDAQPAAQPTSLSSSVESSSSSSGQQQQPLQQPQPQQRQEQHVVASAAPQSSVTPSSISPSGMVLKVFAEEGLPGVYRGIAPELTRGMLSAAVMLMIKERVHVFSQRLLLDTGGEANRAKTTTVQRSSS